MDLKLLKDIKETEKRSKQIVENAENKKVEIIEATKISSIKKYEDFLKSIEQKKESLLADKRLDIRKQKILIRTATEKETEKLETRATPNMGSAVNFIIERFKKSV